MAFNKGDVVQLKSGGPKMTVSATGNYAEGMGLGPEDGVLCVWFETIKGQQKVQEKVFDAAVLQPYVAATGFVAVRRG